MIGMLGIPTRFHSISCAEKRWNFLLEILGLTVDAKTYADEGVEALTWEEKCRLVRSDPVTCARQFHHIVIAYVSNLLQNKDILGCTDYYFWVEFQPRGSPHICVHMFIWVKDAPTQSNENQQEVANYIDQYTSCDISSSNSPDDLTYL